MNAVLIALIVAVASLAGPILLARSNAKARAKEKTEDWARQDAVAAQAAKAAALLLAENRKVAATAVETQGQLRQIHTLVNSNMTAAMQAQLAALKGQLVLMERLAKETPPSEDEVATFKAIEAQIAELEAALHDRLIATESIEAASTTTTTTTTTAKK